MPRRSRFVWNLVFWMLFLPIKRSKTPWFWSPCYTFCYGQEFHGVYHFIDKKSTKKTKTNLIHTWPSRRYVRAKHCQIKTHLTFSIGTVFCQDTTNGFTRHLFLVRTFVQNPSDIFDSKDFNSQSQFILILLW